MSTRGDGERAPARNGRGEDRLEESGGRTPDVYLDVPVLEVDEIDLEVEDLRAHVSLQAEVLDLVKLNVGVDASRRTRTAPRARTPRTPTTPPPSPRNPRRSLRPRTPHSPRRPRSPGKPRRSPRPRPRSGGRGPGGAASPAGLRRAPLGSRRAVRRPRSGEPRPDGVPKKPAGIGTPRTRRPRRAGAGSRGHPPANAGRASSELAVVPEHRRRGGDVLRRGGGRRDRLPRRRPGAVAVRHSTAEPAPCGDSPLDLLRRPGRPDGRGRAPGRRGRQAFAAFSFAARFWACLKSRTSARVVGSTTSAMERREPSSP